MSLFGNILKGFSNKKYAEPDIPFGRYTDAYKSETQTMAFDRALELFDQGDRMGAYRQFLVFLKDETIENVAWEEREDTLHFHFWQGSQRITGTANAEMVKVESKVARAADLQVSILRKLMEVNFNLKFSRFSLSPDNCLTIVFDSHGVDASPLKLQHAFRELSVHADKQDDLLLDEFKNLSPAEAHDFDNIPETEKEIKYNFIQQEIQKAFALLDKGTPDPNRFPGTYAYMLLGLAFRLDYFIKPEGFMMDTLERVYKIYFAQNDKSPQVKIANIRKEFQQLLERSKVDFFKEMYRTKATFGISPAVDHAAIVNLIEGELSNMTWPLQQNHQELALAVSQYIAGFALFHYSPPKPDRDLFHLFYQCLEPAFFKQLGFSKTFADEQGRLDKVAIREALKQLSRQHRAEYPHFKPDVDKLDFGSPALFAQSYLLMIKSLNLKKAE